MIHSSAAIDLLGFDVHADLIRSVITDPCVLPVTVGVFGDWGGGKSGIMKMLQKELSNDETYLNVVCLYFNGWTFEVSCESEGAVGLEESLSHTLRYQGQASGLPRTTLDRVERWSSHTRHLYSEAGFLTMRLSCGERPVFSPEYATRTPFSAIMGPFVIAHRMFE